MQSAWDSVGQRRPQNQVEHKTPPSVASPGEADSAAAASSSRFKLEEDQVHREADALGAEALVCVPHKGNNVSCQIILDHLLASVCVLTAAQLSMIIGLFSGYSYKLKERNGT